MTLRITEICKMQGLTITALADKIGMTRTAVNGYASGRLKPSFDALEKIAIALDVPVVDLFAPHDFTAFIYDKGKMLRFDDRDKLREYINQ